MRQLTILVSLVCLSVVAFAADPAQEELTVLPNKVIHPHNRKPTTPSLTSEYLFLFHLQLHLDQEADRQQLLGLQEKAKALRSHVQRQLQFNDAQAAILRQVAAEYVEEYRAINLEMAPIAKSDREWVKAHGKAAGLPPNRAQVRELGARKKAALQESIDKLNSRLGPEGAAQVQAYLTRRIEAAAKKSVAHPLYDIVDTDSEDVSDYCDDEEICDVITDSEILDSTDAVEIDVYEDSYTDNDDLFDVYGWYEIANGTLYADEDQIWADAPSDPYFAESYGSAPINLTNGEIAFSFPVDGLLCCDEFGYYYQVTYAEADVNLGDPEITSVSPNYAFVGTSGTLSISGNDLITPFYTSTTTTQAQKSGGSGLTVTAEGFSSTEGTASYTAALTATTGTWDIDVNYFLGGSYLVGVNSGFTVGDPTPSISSVSPNSWTAGTLNFSVTIKGSYFGSNPQLSISGAGATLNSITSHSDNGQPGGAVINASVSVANACDSGGTATITVTSTGYNGAGFVSVGGSSSTATASATVVPAPSVPGPAAAPQILFNNVNVAGAQTNVVSGQQIALSGAVPTQACVQVSSWSWTPPNGSAIGGYTPTTTTYTSASVTPLSTNVTSQKFSPFYWAYPGTFTVGLTYTLSNGIQSSTATATFIVTGPSGGKMTSKAYSGMGVSEQLSKCSDPALSAGIYLAYAMAPISGSACPGSTIAAQQGIVFSSPSASNSSGGNFSPVQLISSDTTTGQPASGPGLDTSYPYSPVFPASDSPKTCLSCTGNLSLNRSFVAVMFLMWQSTDSSINSIPVPVGYQAWQFSGSATNSSNGWSLSPGSGGGTQGKFTQSAASQASVPKTKITLTDGYPIWNGLAN